MKKRFFSMLIAVSMIMSILPVYVVQAEHCPGNYEVLFSTFNYGATNNGPSEDVVVSFNEAKMVKVITTYHWNNGYGKTPGSVSIYKDGNLDGTWTATARGGSGASNVNWDVFPDYVMEPGHTYKIVDSDIASWSCNESSGYRGFVEICGYAAEGGTTPDPIEDAKAKALEESGLYAINITDAGAAQIDTWASTGHGKGSVMFPVMSLTPMDWEEPLGYFFRATGEPTLHKLTVYGSKHIDESDITLAGVRSTGVFQETVYGEGEETLYAYTVPFMTHTEDFTISVKVDGQTALDIPCTHIPPEAPHPYVTNLYPEDYTENKDGYLESFTVKIGGFSLPADKSSYKFQRNIDTEPYYNTDFAECSAISAKDEYGEFTLTFTLKENLGIYDLQWLDLLINDSTAWFLSKADHLTANYNGVYNYNGQEQGSNARIASPYAAANRAESTVKSPKFSVPEEADETPVNIGITPNDYEGGKICYSTDGGSTWSKWANIGSSISVPLSNGNGDYNIIFKYKKDGLEEKQSNTYTVTLAVPDKEPEVVPKVTLPTVTTKQNIQATIAAGSYLGGKYAYTTDGWKTSTDYMPVSSKVNVTLPDEYGVYSVAFVFVKEGYISYKTEEIAVDYNDGMAAAPTSGGIIDVSSGKEVSKKGDSYIISGDKESVYRIYAIAPEGQALEAIFKNADGTEAVTKTLSFNSGRKQYEAEITREDMKNAASVDLRVKATGGGLAGHELTLKLKFVEKAFIKALYAPTVHYDVKKDNNGTYYALKPGAVISGAFESAAGEDRTHGMTLTYLTASGESKTVTANAEGDKNGQYYASVTLPEDTASLKQISYELLSEGKVESSATYNVENYRVEANTNITGIGENYIGTTFTLKGADTNKVIVLTEKNYSSIPLGDIKTGEYTYEISGTSGHIVGGTVSVTRDSDIALSDLPALGSVTAQTTGFVSENSGKEVNPKATVVLNIKTPDGKEIKVRGVAGEKMEQIPVGSTGKAELSYDEQSYDEIQNLTGGVQNITVSGDESITAEYKPFTYRTIRGSVWGIKTYPSGFVSTFVPGGAKVVVTQEINRGGKTEIYTQTATVDNLSTTGNRGRWSVRCYDNIPAKIEAKAFTWGTETRTVTENGNVNLGQITMTYGAEMIVKLEAKVETPASVKADGSNYFGENDSVQSSVDSSFINVDRIDAGGKTYYRSSGAYEVETVNGQAYLKIKEGIVVGNESIGVHAYGSSDYGNMTLSLGAWGQDVSVVEDKETGNPVARFTAINYGGELRATVVDNAKSGMTGFLVLFDSDTMCTYAKGTGILSVAYPQYMTNAEKTVVSLMVRDEDADAMTEILNTNCKAIYDTIPNGDLQHDAYYRLRDYDRKLPYVKMGLPQNRIVYLDTLIPTQNIGTEFLPPYRFTYHFELSDNPGKVWLVGTLEKRFPEQIDKDPLRSFEIFVPQGDDFWTANENDLVASSNFYADGRLISPPNVWRKDSVTKSSIVAEIPLGSGNIAACNVVLKYGGQWNGLDSTEQKFTCIEHIPMFTIVNPGDVYIADQLKSQGLGNKSAEIQAGWKLNLAMRIFSTDDDDENIITLYDNGTEIKRFNVSKDKYVYNDTGESIILGGSLQKIPVSLTDNLHAGVHVLWAERTYHGEIMQTEPIVFSLVEGAEHNEIYISELNWTHWNSRIPGQPDKMYFENLSDIAGANIWVWPGKRHQMSFKVNNATSKELEGVTVAYQTLEAKTVQIPAGATSATFDGLTSLSSGYQSVTKRIECRLISENRNSNYSIWGFDDADMGYLQGFEFEFQYNAAIKKEVASMTLSEMEDLETDSFYRAHSLGDVPDLDSMAETISEMTDDEVVQANKGFSNTAETLPELNFSVKENTGKKFRMELENPTDKISEFTVTMQENGTAQLPDVWSLMDTEREYGNQNPDEEGWEVTWAEFDTEQGEVLIRMAYYEGDDENGKGAILTHNTYYLPDEVTDTIIGGSSSSEGGSTSIGTGGEIGGGTGGTAVISPTSPTLNDLTQNWQSGTNDDHWTKTVYDYSSFIYSVGDIGYRAVKDFLWFGNQISLNPNDWSPTPDLYKIYNWDETSKFAKGADVTFKVLGVADTVITWAKGPSGNDPNTLRQLLSMVQDEKARKSLEWQIKDYEELRKSIYASEGTYSTFNTAVGFIPGGIVAKVGLFIGGLVNSYLTNDAKSNNNQVYNSTLHDIQLQLKIEKRRAEIKAAKSYDEAQQWLHDRMDHFYGKGKWSQHALQEELKYWVLVRFPDGTVKYVWHEKVPNFSVYLDPSGYVFEGSEDNRIDDVKATLYYSDTEDGNYSVWTDPSGEQYNPQYTSDEGRYSWMVPTGWWKVLYEKEGYLPSLTNPMAVPPIHTAVNIGLLSNEAPKAAISADNGKMTVLFSKYMQLESLIRLFEDETYAGKEFDASAFTIQFYDKNGVAIPGTVTFPDKIANTGYLGSAYSREVIDSDWFVRTAIFTPEDKTVDLSSATWVFADGIKSYSGVELDKNGSPENLYLISLNAGEGTLSIPSLITSSNGSLSKLPSPVREGYTFDGWYTSQTGGTKVTTDTVFDSNTTLYAHWAKESTDSGDSGKTHGGGGGGISKYEVTAVKADNGSVSLSPTNAAKGSTVTITVSPDEGYRLAGLTVTDQNGKEIAITEKDGKYTFIMPTGKATVTPVFEKADGAVKNPFVDVKNSDYFYDAVLWAVNGNITKGTSDTTFSPNESCTRAQTVTFLWRAAGSPEPKKTKNPFTDINEDDYYYKAVLWAYQNGITSGTTNSTFSPEESVTRAQTVTFLYRLEGEKTESKTPLTDISNDDYYYDSVLWAYENGITSGTTDTTFSPNNDCLRAQIITFLHRCYN
ncbi:MAG TPA: hypothetical protein DCO93_00940 [Clostridiales bacterium]|nr:hypothetical protein [Clostridiales bacterium]